MPEAILLSVRVTPDVASRLTKLAESTDRSKSYLAAEAIEDYLNVHEWQIQAIKDGIKAASKGEVSSLENVKKRWERKREALHR